MVGMLLRWRWKGGKKGGEEEEEIREPIIYHSQTTRRNKVRQVYIYPHHTSLYRDTNIPEISTSTFPPRYHTNPSIRYTHYNTLLLHLHLVSLIIITMNKPQAASCNLPYIPTYLQKYMVQHTYTYISSTIENYLGI